MNQIHQHQHLRYLPSLGSHPKFQEKQSKTHRYQSHTRVPTKPIHLPLLLPIAQIIVILHAHKLRPPILLRDELHLRKLRRPHRTRPDIPHLPTLHEVMQRAHRLLDRGVGIKPMDLEEIDVISLEAFEGSFDGIVDGCARKSWVC